MTWELIGGSKESLLHCAMWIVLHQETFFFVFFFFFKCTGLKYTGNKLPLIRLSQVWSRLRKSICTACSFLSFCQDCFPVWYLQGPLTTPFKAYRLQVTLDATSFSPPTRANSSSPWFPSHFLQHSRVFSAPSPLDSTCFFAFHPVHSLFTLLFHFLCPHLFLNYWFSLQFPSNVITLLWPKSQLSFSVLKWNELCVNTVWVGFQQTWASLPVLWSFEQFVVYF